MTTAATTMMAPTLGPGTGGEVVVVVEDSVVDSVSGSGWGSGAGSGSGSGAG